MMFTSSQSLLIDTPESVARRIDPKTEKESTQEYPEYDVVIIGGGAAGCVLASRLSENPDLRILLLEAGGSSRNLMKCKIPGIFGQTMHSDLDYNLWTEPQSNANGKKKYWPRAKLLGGCTAINAMMFHTCAPTDYDEWAQFLSGQDGASGWAYKEFSKYFLKFEKFIPHPRSPDVDTSIRGTNGPVKVGFFGNFHRTNVKWIESCVKLGIPQTPDLNTSKGTIGVAKALSYIDSGGKRVTTETAYLTPEVLKRANLKVSVHSRVTRILFDTSTGKKKAVAVEFARQKGGTRYRVRAKHEIVLSAGAIHSPHILMLSGVGPKDQLAASEVPVIHDLPGVGQNLQDHASVVINLRVKRGQSSSFLKAGINPAVNIDTFRALTALARWKVFGTGPLVTHPGRAAAFVRSTDANLFPPDSYHIEDMSSGSSAPDLETISNTVGFTEHGHGAVPGGDLISMIAVLLRPQSSGTLTLNSSDPFDAPVIDPNYLSTQNDIACLVRGLKLNLRTAQTEPLASIIVHDDDPALDHNLHHCTDAELESEVRKRAETLYHPTTTCRMAKLKDGGVVDSYLKVYGIENLRVADASIFPRIPSGHTTAPSIAVGEKASDIIKQSLSSS